MGAKVLFKHLVCLGNTFILYSIQTGNTLLGKEMQAYLLH